MDNSKSYRKIIILLTALYFGSISVACSAEELRDPALDQIVEKVKADYGINLHYSEGPVPKFSGFNYGLAGVGDKEILKSAVLIFVQEIGLYPKDIFRYAHCQDIYFVKKFFYEELPIDGFFSLSTNYIFYDYLRGSNNTQKTRHKIHHEIYHLIGSKHSFWKEHGPEWNALNRAGFSYDPKYHPQERNPVNFYAPSELGFVTDYAMWSAEEDRAEVFACMMIPQEFRLLKQWAQKDNILFEKLKMMKEFLSRL